MYKVAPQLMRIDQLTPAPTAELADLAKAEGPMSGEPFRSPVTDFYMTNPIARASKTMAECSALKNVQKLEAAE
jgi:NADH-quinone oxidoreductase subunit G